MAPAGVELFVVCKVWDSVVETDSFRKSIKNLSGSASLPSVIIRQSAKDKFAVVARGGRTSEEKQICCGSVIADVQSAFESRYGEDVGAGVTMSRIEFQVQKDRPGLLAEASALFKSHQVNIRRALISTADKGHTAKHVYEFTDSTTGKEVSSETFSGLKKGFERLQIGGNPNTVEPVSVKPAESLDELRVKVLELTAQLEASKADNARLSIALEEAFAKK